VLFGFGGWVGGRQFFVVLGGPLTNTQQLLTKRHVSERGGRANFRNKGGQLWRSHLRMSPVILFWYFIPVGGGGRRRLPVVDGDLVSKLARAERGQRLLYYKVFYERDRWLSSSLW